MQNIGERSVWDRKRHNLPARAIGLGDIKLDGRYRLIASLLEFSPDGPAQISRVSDAISGVELAMMAPPCRIADGGGASHHACPASVARRIFAGASDLNPLFPKHTFRFADYRRFDEFSQSTARKN